MHETTWSTQNMQKNKCQKVMTAHMLLAFLPQKIRRSKKRKKTWQRDVKEGRNKIGWTDIKMSYRMRKPRPGCGNRSPDAETAVRKRNCAADAEIASKQLFFGWHNQKSMFISWSYLWYSSFKAIAHRRDSSEHLSLLARSFARYVVIINANNN